MHFLHFADTHIGVTTHGKHDIYTGLNTRVLDYLESMDLLVEYAREVEPDLVVFAGDAFHNNNPIPAYVNEFGKRIFNLSKVCPIVMIPGNHDMTSARTTTPVDLFGVFGNHNVHVITQPGVITLETKSGMVNVAGFPYPHKRHHIDMSQRASVVDERAMFMLALEDKLEMMEDTVRYDKHPSIFVGHFTVAGCVYGSERGMALGVDSEFLLEHLAKPVWKYVALGHIHKHQNMTKGQRLVPPVVYAGSLDRIDFGEEHDTKGFCHVTISNYGNTTYKFVDVDPRPFQTFSYDLTNMTAKEMLAVLTREKIDPNAIVRVVIDTQDREPIDTEGVYRILEKRTHSCTVTVRAKNTRKAVRLATEGEVGTMPMGELLKLYFQESGERPADIDELMGLFTEIAKDVS